MKAKLISETVNFERGLDPKRAMNIGLTPKRILDNFIKKMLEFGIEISYTESQTDGPDVFDLEIMDEEDWENDRGYQFSYASDKAAKDNWGDEEPDIKGGFMLYDENGEVLEGPIHNPNKIIKRLVIAKYGNKYDIQRKIKKMTKEIQKLQQIDKALTEI